MKTYQNQAEWHKQATPEIKNRLEYFRKLVRSEETPPLYDMSYGEIAELQDLADYIELGDVELLEAAGIPEYEYGYCGCDDNTSLIAGETCEECGQRVTQEATA